MENKFRFFVIVFLILCGRESFAQKFYTASQITGLPMQYIPSFAGNLGRIRVASETQFFNAKEFYKESSVALSVDGFVPKLSSGLGLSLYYYNRTSQIFNDLRNPALGLTFAPKISIRGKYTLSPGLEIIANNYQYDSTHYTRMSETISLLFNTKKIYVGAAFNSNVKELKVWTLFVQVGATFQRTEESKFSFSPSIAWANLYSGYYDKFYNLSKEGNFKNIYMPDNVNLNFRYQKVLFGVGFYGFMVGVQHKNFRIMYSANGFFTRNAITLRVLFNNKNSKSINY